MRRTLPSLKGQALALLARREHSRAELRSKLLQHARKLAAEADATSGDDPLQAFFTPETSPLVDEDAASEARVAEVEAVLDWLVAQRHQSDQRFIESRVHARAGKFGQARIRQELARHGVELDVDTAAELRASELSRAREVWRKRFDQPPADPAQRAKQMRFLAARGFGGDVIRRVIGGSEDD